MVVMIFNGSERDDLSSSWAMVTRDPYNARGRTLLMIRGGPGRIVLMICSGPGRIVVMICGGPERIVLVIRSGPGRLVRGSRGPSVTNTSVPNERALRLN